MDNYDIMAGSCPNCVVADKEIEALEDRLDAADRETVAWFDIERVKLTAADALATAAEDFEEAFEGSELIDDLVIRRYEALIAALRKYREADNG